MKGIAVEERQAARSQIAPGTPVGVTEEMIARLVDVFYARIRIDPELGPIFNSSIVDWDVHLAKLRAFWSSVTLMSGRYKGTPMAVHAELPGISPAHFARWLALFRDTTGTVCPPEAAALFVARAETIARSLQLGIAASRGELPTITSPYTPRVG